MKKLLAIILTLAMTFGLCVSFTGCGGDKEQKLYDKYDLSEYIVLPDYEKYEYEKPIPTEVTEEEMQAGIEKDLAYYGITYKNTSEGTVNKGDTITISYVGTLADGTTPEDMKAENYSIVLGQANLLEGFQESLYGASVGETVTCKTTFPDPYITDVALSGKDVTFEITVTSKDRIELPELTNRLIREAHNDYYQTVDEYMVDVRKYYENLHEEEVVNALRDDIYTRLIEETEVLKYPEEEVTYEQLIYLEQHANYASNNSIEWETYLSDYLGMTEDELMADAEEYAKLIVKQEMIVYAIAEKEGLEITDEEFEAGKTEFLEETAQMTEAEFEENMGMTFAEYAEKYKLERELLKEEVIDCIYDKAVK